MRAWTLAAPAAVLVGGLACAPASPTGPAADLRIAHPAAAQADAPLCGTVEIALTASRSYEAAGRPNPFAETLLADVRSPSARQTRVRGFYDGDGAGGPDGAVFAFRVLACEAGPWSWQVASGPPGTEGSRGTFQAVPAGGPFAGGPVEVSPRNPHVFLAGGRPTYLLAKFLDEEAPRAFRYSHTLFSEKRPERERQAFLARHREMGLNRILVYLFNVDDYDGPPTTPWTGSAGRPDRSRFELSRWRTWERWVRILRDQGIVAHLWIFPDDSGVRRIPRADRARLVSEALARLAAFPNVMLTLALEWQEDWEAAEVEEALRAADSENPWGRPLGVHGLPGEFAFPAADCLDYAQIQPGNDASPRAVHDLGVGTRRAAARPVLNEEFGLGREDRRHRANAWAAFCGGAAGSATGAFLLHLARFAGEVPFEEMEPAPERAISGSAFVLAAPDRHLVACLPQGGAVSLDLSGWEVPPRARWYDPRTGTSAPAGVDAAGGRLSATAPDGQDWILHLEAP